MNFCTLATLCIPAENAPCVMVSPVLLDRGCVMRGRVRNGWVFAGMENWAVDMMVQSDTVVLTVRHLMTGGLLGCVFYTEERCPRWGRERWCSMAKSFVEKLLNKTKAEKNDTDAGHDEELANECPHVHELLTRKLMDGKKAIEPASLTVFCRKGSFHVCLTHKGLDLKWWGEGGTLKTALEALEASIGAEAGEDANTNGTTRPHRV